MDLFRSKDPESRGKRKELEKKAGYGYKEPLLLAAIGIGLVWNIENQVNKCCEQKNTDAKRDSERLERQRRRKEDDLRREGGRGPQSTDSGRRSLPGSRRSDRDRESRHRNSSRHVDEGYRRDLSRPPEDRYRRDPSRHPDEGYRRDSSRYPDDGYPREGSRERRMDDYERGYSPEEYRGYRDQYRDYHNDYRYEERRDGSVRRSSRRDSF